MKFRYKAKKIISFLLLCLLINLIASCGSDDRVVKSGSGADGKASYIDGSFINNPNQIQNNGDNRIISAASNDEIQDESAEGVPTNKTKTEELQIELEDQNTKQLNEGEPGSIQDDKNSVEPIAGVITNNSKNEKTEDIDTEKQADADNTSDISAEIIVKSENVLSDQEKEVLLKEIESEIDALFDEINNISEEQEADEQDGN